MMRVPIKDLRTLSLSQQLKHRFDLFNVCKNICMNIAADFPSTFITAISVGIMQLSLASPWVDPGDIPGELFFVTNKSHSNPEGKGHKINDK